MKIQVISDLHLEFQKAPVIENAGADVLILGGDICLAEHLYRNPRFLHDIHGDVNDLSNIMQNNGWYAGEAEKYRRFFHHCDTNWDRVYYVMGNHEHYSGRWNRTEQVLRDELNPYPNIQLLEQSKMVFNDVVFLGATLWTDLDNRDPLTMLSIKDMMSDYRAITEVNNEAYHKLRPLTTAMRNAETVQWLKLMLEEDKRKTVIVTHHTPSRRSIHPRYQDQKMMNSAFCNNLDDLMLDHDHIALWTHGHVHDRWDYTIGNTRIVCNPHGYPGEHKEFDPHYVVEI